MDFWDVHGIWFIVFMLFFPRLTILFATVWGGFWWWLGLIFTPRLMCAILATVNYWNTNPVLCVLAWIVAIPGESLEKKKLASQ